MKLKETLLMFRIILHVRDSDSVLGVVGDRYQVVQNKQCFDFLDTVVDDSEATFETAGSLNEGRIVWMLLNLVETLL